MKRNKVLPIFVVGASAALALSACSSTVDVKKSEGAATTASFTVGADEYGGYNSSISSLYSTGNSVINDRMASSFGYFEANGEWHKGGDLGDYEMVSESPLTVKYTINEKAVYEGGTPITCEDFYLDWVAQNPQWILDGQKAAGNVDDAGNGAPLFDNVSSPDSYAGPVKNGPECNAGDREFTVTYDAPNPDWQLVISGVRPSHVVATQIGLDKEKLFEALKAQDFEVAKKAADYWNNWYSKNAGELQPAEEIPSFGPYTLKQGGWKKGEYVTLVKNPDWWGEPGGVDELVVRFIAPEGQIQALANKDVNVIEPQATQDALDTLANTAGVKVLTGSTMIWEHLDYNFADTSVFSEGQGGLKLRQAFALCAPRQDIVDKLVKKLDPEAQLMNSREYFVNDPEYAEVVAASYNGEYDKVDLEKAKQLIAESGVANPTVRIGYSAPNQRRADTVALIKASCDQAGFTIEDIGAENFFAPEGALATGQYDIALFAWSGSGQVVSGANIFKSTGQQNFSQWNNAEVDAAWAKVEVSLDPAVHKAAKIEFEKAAWADLLNLPIYAHPGIAAHTEGLKNVERNVTQNGIVWNAEKWAW
ncbi:MAG: ABC transporter substrate-binding protein [Arcanobacterium sp.]|nr:ABC transporter substrate-binding protein [Arcanobacterium sp.]